MRNIFLLCLLLGVSQLSVGQNIYPGTTIRGRMLTFNQFGQQVPFVSTRVDLYFFNPQFQQWQVMGTSYTDAYGFFSFRFVPVNNYVIKVNGTKNYQIQVIPIDYRFYQFQELGTFMY